VPVLRSKLVLNDRHLRDAHHCSGATLASAKVTIVPGLSAFLVPACWCVSGAGRCKVPTVGSGLVAAEDCDLSGSDYGQRRLGRGIIVSSG